MFGHTFLTFTQPNQSPLLAATLNYAADTAQQDGVLDFIIKGLFGGFPGTVDRQPFFRRLRTYVDNEGRDLWEYQLQLAPEQIRLMLLHIWEGKDGEFDYYFVGENCAYQTLALLQVARPDLPLMEQYPGAVVPIDTVRTLQRAGLVANVVYWPSSPKLLHQHAALLTPAEVQIAILIGRETVDVEHALKEIDPTRRAMVLNLALEYVTLASNRDEIGIDKREAITRDLIAQRARYDAAPEPVAMSTPRAGAGSSRALAFGRLNYYFRKRRSIDRLLWIRAHSA